MIKFRYAIQTSISET